MKEIFIRGGESVKRMRDLPDALRELYELAVANGFDPEWYDREGVSAHELDHALEYFLLTDDEDPEVWPGIRLNDDGTPKSLFVGVPVQDDETLLRIFAAPKKLSPTDRENVKKLLRKLRQRR